MRRWSAGRFVHVGARLDRIARRRWHTLSEMPPGCRSPNSQGGRATTQAAFSLPEWSFPEGVRRAFNAEFARVALQHAQLLGRDERDRHPVTASAASAAGAVYVAGGRAR